MYLDTSRAEALQKFGHLVVRVVTCWRQLSLGLARRVTLEPWKLRFDVMPEAETCDSGSSPTSAGAPSNHTQLAIQPSNIVFLSIARRSFVPLISTASRRPHLVDRKDEAPSRLAHDGV